MMYVTVHSVGEGGHSGTYTTQTTEEVSVHYQCQLHHLTISVLHVLFLSSVHISKQFPCKRHYLKGFRSRLRNICRWKDTSNLSPSSPTIQSETLLLHCHGLYVGTKHFLSCNKHPVNARCKTQLPHIT